MTDYVVRDRTQGPSPSFGTRAMNVQRMLCTERQRAVVSVCSLAAERGVDEVAAILDILGLDPSEGRVCKLHGEECYVTRKSPSDDEESTGDGT